MLEEYSVKICKIDRYFYEHYKEKIQVDKSGHKYILFRIDVYITKYLWAIEIDEKGHTDRPYFWWKKARRVKENLIANLLELIRVKKAMMQTMKLVEYKHLSVNLKTGK